MQHANQIAQDATY